ncbi:hypothetical protein [Oenococcus sicerae]|uniref:hypothetical protein n=1 Tax=Oenococcus sicerae TaxID=2203724 RepID=UPI0039EA1362
MDDIVFTLEFNGDTANSEVNQHLISGWKLLHVGQHSYKDADGQLMQEVIYVIGADKKAYKQHKHAQNKAKKSPHD